MKRKVVTPEADAALADVFAHINSDNPPAAEKYYRAALDAFFELPDLQVPVRAGDHLPDYVRSLRVPGYAGYTLRIAIFDEAVFLLTALRPGASNEINDARTEAGLRGV